MNEEYSIITLEPPRPIPEVKLKSFGVPTWKFDVRPIQFTVKTPEWINDPMYLPPEPPAPKGDDQVDQVFEE